jgi:hypothetical protein
MLQIWLMAVTKSLGWRNRADLLRLERLSRNDSPSFPIQPINTLMIVLEAFPLEENMHASIAVMHSRCRNFPDAHEQYR